MSLLTLGAFFLLGVVALAPAAYFFRRQPHQIVSPVVLQGLSTVLFGVVGGVFVLRDPDVLIAGEQSARLLPAVTLLMLLSFVCFCLGYVLVPPPHRLPAKNTIVWDQQRIAVVVGILVCVAWVARLYAASHGVVVAKLVSDGAAAYIQNPIMLALFYRSGGLISMAAVICVVASNTVGANRPRAARTWQVAAIVLLAVESSYFTLVQLTRMQVVAAWFGPFCAMAITGRPPWRRMLLFAVLFVGVIMPVVHTAKSLPNEDRMYASIRDSEPTLVRLFPAAVDAVARDYPTRFIASLGHSTRFSEADLLIAITEEQWRGTPPMGMEPIVAPLAGLVPRVIWPDKPLAFDTTRMIKGYYGYWDDEDVIVRPLSQYYAAFGIPGVLIGMFVQGLLAHLLYRALAEHRTWVTGIALYAAVGYEVSFGSDNIAGTLAPLRDLLILWLFLKLMLEVRLPAHATAKAGLARPVRLSP